MVSVPKHLIKDTNKVLQANSDKHDNQIESEYLEDIIYIHDIQSICILRPPTLNWECFLFP